MNQIFFDIASDNEVPTQPMEVDPVPETMGPSGVPFILRRKKVLDPPEPMEEEESQQPVEKWTKKNLVEQEH